MAPNGLTTSNGHNPASQSTFIQRIVWPAFFYSFALFNYFLYLFLAIKSGTFFKKDTEQDQLRFAISRDRFWNLSKQPIPGFEHAFFKLRSGRRLHYITNRTNASRVKGGNLFVLLHGFPDSCMMWRYCAKEPGFPMETARIVCLDLPNFGGSDTFEKADTEVLEAITEFIVAMREEHEEAASDNNKDFSTIIVAHDWGCVIGFRLAADAPMLADRFILMNGPHVELSLANKDRVIGSATKIFKQFKESPSKNFGCLHKSFKVMKPLLFQTLSFGYIFAFHLPSFMVQYLGVGGNMAFLKGVFSRAYGKASDDFNIQEPLAATLGPGVIEVETKTASGETYGPSVHARAASSARAFWTMTAYYRDGLATSHWDKTIETVADLYNLESSASAGNSPLHRRSSSSASSALFTEQYKGSLRAPCTILWGEKDIAVGKAICLDGIGDYLARGSEVIILPRTAHWTTVDREGRKTVVKAMSLCAKDGKLPVYIAKDVDSVYTGAEVMVKK